MTTGTIQEQMAQVNLRELKDIIRHSVLRLNKPLFAWGSPGIGKTEAPHRSARR